MPPIQLPLPLAQRHHNQHLFSDHYLNVTLPANADWQSLAHDAGAALAAISPIVRAFMQAPSKNEAQTEDELIKPILRALGHTFEIQAALKTPDGTKKPDYDLGVPDKALNQKLTAWWDLDFPAFRAEIQKVFKRDIPLKDRDDWEEWLQSRRAEHTVRTDAIIRMETDLNARVYALFDLTPAEIKIVEESTKYTYGEV